MNSAALSVTYLPPAWQPLIHPPIAATAGFANFRFILVTSSIKLLQRLHMAPRIISRPYLSIYSSLGPAELSKLISYTLHPPPPTLQPDPTATYSSNRCVFVQFLRPFPLLKMNIPHLV